MNETPRLPNFLRHTNKYIQGLEVVHPHFIIPRRVFHHVVVIEIPVLRNQLF